MSLLKELEGYSSRKGAIGRKLVRGLFSGQEVVTSLYISYQNVHTMHHFCFLRFTFLFPEDSFMHNYCRVFLMGNLYLWLVSTFLVTEKGVLMSCGYLLSKTIAVFLPTVLYFGGQQWESFGRFPTWQLLENKCLESHLSCAFYGSMYFKIRWYSWDVDLVCYRMCF